MFDIILAILAISAYGFGKLNGTLPITISNALIFFLFIRFLIFTFRKRSFQYSIYFITLICLMLIGAFFNYNIGHIAAKIQYILYAIIYSSSIAYILNRYSPETVLGLYIRFCYWLAILGLIQFSLTFIGFDVLNQILRYFSENKSTSSSGDFIRVTSIASEPALLGIYLLPALVASISRIFSNAFAKNYITISDSCIILLVALLTFSLIVYVYIAIISLFFFIKSGRRYDLVLLFFSLIYLLSINSDSINSRLIEVADFKYSNNLSIAALYSNILVTIDSLYKFPFFGSGVVSHAVKFDNMFNLGLLGNASELGLNKDDAASMYLLVLSEMGIFGFVLFYSIIFTYFAEQPENSNRFIQEVFLLSFLLYGIRYGSINTAMFWLYLAGFISTSKTKFGLRSIRF